MLGLFDSLSLGARSLSAAQTGVQVAGQNLANVNNPAYARQRVQLQTAIALPTPYGPQGTGVNVTSIQSLRNLFVDAQIVREQSAGGYITSTQSALQNAQASLGEFLNGNASALDGTSASGALTGLGEQLTGLFNAFQSVATSPASLSDRQALITQAQTLATRLNQTSSRLDALDTTLDASLNADVNTANGLLSDIAKLNDQIVNAELPGSGNANDLRDLRQEKLESLAKLVNFDSSTAANGTVSISIDGVQMVDDRNVLDTLQTYDAGGGQLLVRATTAGTPLAITGGSIAGTIDVRDGTLADLHSGLDALASALITQVNAVHSAGYSLTGTTGEAFFTGTDAATIGVNATLAGDPRLIQAAGAPGVVGDNTVALSLAQLATQPQAALSNRTFNGAYSDVVAGLGHALNSANDQMSQHDAVASMLSMQRDSTSGVSIDEEMTDLIKFQKAYQASARIISSVSEMIDTVIRM